MGHCGATSRHSPGKQQRTTQLTDPTLAAGTDFGRMYARTRGGELLVPSITTIQGVMESDMSWWAALCAAKGVIEDDRMAQYYAMPDGQAKKDKKRALIDWYRLASDRDMNASAARGDIVHNYAEFYALHVMGRATPQELQEKLDLAQAAGLDAYIRSFHAFWDKYRPVPIAPEATVWNHTIGYAGTTDLICSINGVTAVLDYKTKKKIRDYYGHIKPTTLSAKIVMQLTAAARAEEYWVEGATPAEDEWLPWPHKPEIGFGLAIGPDDFFLRPFDIWNERSWSTFVSLRSVWDWKREGESLAGPGIFELEQVRPDIFSGGVQLPQTV